MACNLLKLQSMPTNIMTSDTPLNAGEYLVSSNRRFFAIVQGDGNFCVYQGDSPGNLKGLVWAGNSYSDPIANYQLRLQAQDGNLVVYNGSNVAWASGGFDPVHRANPHAPPSPCWGCMQDDGLFCVRQGVVDPTMSNPTGIAGAYWWTSNVALPPAPSIEGLAEQTPNQTRALVLKGLSALPKVGSIVSGLVGFFWKDNTTLWDQIKVQVEALIQQDLDAEVLSRTQAALSGLKSNLDDYIAYADRFNNLSNPSDQPTPAEMLTKFSDAQSAFETNAPYFREQGYETLLLPLMASMATMQLSLYRDGVLFGADWGMTPGSVQDLLTKTQGLITNYQSYVGTQVASAAPPGGVSGAGLVEFNSAERAKNSYMAYMQLNVLDLSDLWTYADPIAYPPGFVAPPLTREIFSGPYALPISLTSEGLPASGDAPPISQLTLAYSYILRSIDVVYGPPSNPPSQTSGTPYSLSKLDENGWPEMGIYLSTQDPIVCWSGTYQGILGTAADDYEWMRQQNLPANLTRYRTNPLQGPHDYGNLIPKYDIETLSMCNVLTKSGQSYNLYSMPPPAYLITQAYMVTMQYPGHILSSIRSSEYGYVLGWRREDSYSEGA